MALTLYESCNHLKEHCRQNKMFFFQENISFSNLEQLCSQDKLKACLPNSHHYYLILVGGVVGGVTQIMLINNITYPHLNTSKP